MLSRRKARTRSGYLTSSECAVASRVARRCAVSEEPMSERKSAGNPNDVEVPSDSRLSGTSSRLEPCGKSGVWHANRGIQVGAAQEIRSLACELPLSKMLCFLLSQLTGSEGQTSSCQSPNFPHCPSPDSAICMPKPSFSAIDSRCGRLAHAKPDFPQAPLLPCTKVKEIRLNLPSRAERKAPQQSQDLGRARACGRGRPCSRAGNRDRARDRLSHPLISGTSWELLQVGNLGICIRA